MGTGSSLKTTSTESDPLSQPLRLLSPNRSRTWGDPVVVARATEKECQRTIVDAAKLGGWLVYHNRPSQTGSGRWATALQGHQGFPDLVLVHRTARLVWFVELKRRPNGLSPDQKVWREVLVAAGAEHRIVWVPDEQDAFCQLLVDAGANRPPRRVPAFFDPGLVR